MITLIAIQQEMVWKHTIKQCLHYDFCHTWDYHRMADEGIPYLLKFSFGDDFVVLPVIKRSIPNTKWFDFASVDGFCGPLSNKNFKTVSNQMKIAFKREFSSFLRDNQIVSVFVRFNPFFNQLLLFEAFEAVHYDRKLVVMDLRLTLEQQLAGYQKHHLKKILRIRDQGFFVKEDKSPASIKEFAGIYHESLKRAPAIGHKKLDEDYFQEFFLAKDFDSRLFIVYHGSVAVCGQIVTSAGKIMHTHLLAALPAYRKFALEKLLTHEISLRARDRGMHFFNLGDDLSLMQGGGTPWKSAFSSLRVDDCSWRHIADHKMYNKLSIQAGMPEEVNSDLFPLYRYKSDVSEPRPGAASNYFPVNESVQVPSRRKSAVLPERI